MTEFSLDKRLIEIKPAPAYERAYGYGWELRLQQGPNSTTSILLTDNDLLALGVASIRAMTEIAAKAITTVQTEAAG